MPVKRVLLIHHSHTDIGYTMDQPVVWELGRRFLDAALDLAGEGADDADDAFRWTVETTGPLLHWLRHASDRQIEQLKRLERVGRIEITGMLANLTPLVDTDQLIDTLQPIRLLRERYGFSVRHAMNCDVNGHNWPLVDVLLDAGIEAFSMAVNDHFFGGAPLDRPSIFRWQGPSGRKLPTLHGWHYMFGNWLGIPEDAERLQTTWPEIARRLEERQWPLDCIAIQLTDGRDNGTADPRLPAFVRRWNAEGNLPHLRLALPREWWGEVHAAGVELPVLRGDWTDFWNFGAISTAREQRVNRQSRSRLRAADAFAIAPFTRQEDGRALRRERDRIRESAWHSLHFWDEHTWGASNSIGAAESDDTVAQWYHKAHFAYRARSLSMLLQRDAVADLARWIARDARDAVVVFNPSAWPREAGGPVTDRLLTRRGLSEDFAATRHAVDRDGGSVQKWLPAVVVPGFGWRVVQTAELLDPGKVGASEIAVVENHRHRIAFDRQRGGIAAWYDKRLGRELVDATAPWPMAGFVHEEVADHDHDFPRYLLYRRQGSLLFSERGWGEQWRAHRSGAVLRSHRVWHTARGWHVEQRLGAPAVDDIRLEFSLPDRADYLEVRASWRMRPTVHPESTYLFFPFVLDAVTARFDAGGVAVRIDEDQLPQCCRDYFTVQRWVDLSDATGGMTIATPDNPLIQVGDFNFGRGARQANIRKPWLLGWVTNNYWHTNFRAHQGGAVQARYALMPYAGKFDEAAAHRLGEEFAQPMVLAPVWEPPQCAPALPRECALLKLPAPPVLVLHILPVETGALLRVFNASDQPQHARFGSGVLVPRQAQRCDLYGGPLGELTRSGDEWELELPPRGLAMVRLDL